MPPRAWNDTSVPVFPEGCDKLDFYCSWLVDHLMNSEICPSTRQLEFLDAMRLPFIDFFAEHYPEGLGVAYKDAMPAFEILEASHASGETWAQFDARQFAFWKNENVNSTQVGWGYDTEWRCGQRIWEAIGEECRERQQAGPIPEYPDIPYRAFLSFEIRETLDIADKTAVIAGYLAEFDIPEMAINHS
jgi:hypothetical protein